MVRYDLIDVGINDMDKRQSDIIKIAKGMCIFLVVLGHTMIPSIRGEEGIIFNIWTVIYLFHMPTFFAISGILYELNRGRYEENPVQFIKRKFNLLIIPYLTISIAVYLVLIVIEEIPEISELVVRYVHSVDSIYGAVAEILTYENHVAQHLWFVLVLFLIFLTNIVLRKCNQKILCIVLTAAPIFALPVLKMLFDIPDIPNYFLFELPFFMFGRLIEQNRNILQAVAKENFFPIVFIFLAGMYVEFINDTDVLPLPIRWIYLFTTRCSGVFMVFSISAWMEKRKQLKTAFEYLERKSYSIYLLHQPFIVSGMAGVLFAAAIPNLVIIFMVTIFGFVIPLIIDKMFSKAKLYQVLILGGRIK